jgi:hypothetical protein
LSWSTSALATSYEVQVSLSSTFGSTILDQSGASLTSATLNGLTNSTTYYWRANASNAGGASAWSSMWSFMTVKPVSVIQSAPVLPIRKAPVVAKYNLLGRPAGIALGIRIGQQKKVIYLKQFHQ